MQGDAHRTHHAFVGRADEFVDEFTRQAIVAIDGVVTLIAAQRCRLLHIVLNRDRVVAGKRVDLEVVASERYKALVDAAIQQGGSGSMVDLVRAAVLRFVRFTIAFLFLFHL